jgi:hypothetical protein
MTSVRSLFRVVCINVAVLLVLVALLVLIPPAFLDLYRYRAGRAELSIADARASLPTYKGVSWARRHFEEFAKLRTTYYDYIGWRRNSFTGETITIDGDGYRRHAKTARREDAQIWAFGGSTMWGPGVTDSLTIPAFIERDTSRSTFNFGESGYTAHQSLNLLMKNYALGGRPQHVVFYDGANEVVIKCRAELTFYSALQEATIRQKLRTDGAMGSSLLKVFTPTVEVLRRITEKWSSGPETGPPESFDCSTNASKRRLIAASLVMDWQAARQLNGGTFIAVLQPVAFVGEPELSHLPSVRSDALMKAQYDSVYPEIIRQLREAKLPYTDMTHAFDGREQLYIDFVHVAPRGNEIMGQRIAGLLK